MRACRGAARNRPQAMLIQSAHLFRYGRGTVHILLVGGQEGSFQEWSLLVEYPVVSGCLHVVRGNKRKPQQVVREASAHTAPGRWVPPVLHVTLFKLSLSTSQYLLAGNIRRGVHQGHDIL